MYLPIYPRFFTNHFKLLNFLLHMPLHLNWRSGLLGASSAYIFEDGFNRLLALKTIAHLITRNGEVLIIFTRSSQCCICVSSKFFGLSSRISNMQHLMTQITSDIIWIGQCSMMQVLVPQQLCIEEIMALWDSDNREQNATVSLICYCKLFHPYLHSNNLSKNENNLTVTSHKLAHYALIKFVLKDVFLVKAI